MKPTIRITLIIICLASLWGASCRKEVAGSAGPSGETLLDHLQNNYAFSLFYHALQRTGLDKQLNGKNNYTLLIPDNDAFANDGIFTTDSLDRMDTASLRAWMSYHIVAGSIKVADVPQTVNNPYTSISGEPLWFSRPVPGFGQSQTDFDHILHINGDTVNSPDIIAPDGVIQVLSSPLKLPVLSIQTWLSAQPQYSEFVTCLQHFGLWDQLAGPGPITVFAPENASFLDVRISPDSLSRLDTVRFQQKLFGIYIVNPARIFLTDFYDIPFPPSIDGQYYITPNNTYNFSSGALIDGGLDPVTGQGIPNAYWIAPNLIMTNGVVHGMHGVLLTPGQTKK